jgi:hypothetical protein
MHQVSRCYLKLIPDGGTGIVAGFIPMGYLQESAFVSP